jgi:hypothetical protein
MKKAKANQSMFHVDLKHGKQIDQEQVYFPKSAFKPMIFQEVRSPKVERRKVLTIDTTIIKHSETPKQQKVSPGNIYYTQS